MVTKFMSDADYSKKNKGVVAPVVKKYTDAEQKSWLATWTSYGLSWTQAQAVVPDTTTRTITNSWYVPTTPTYFKESKTPTLPEQNTQSFVPEPVKIDASFISFWDDARGRNEVDGTYLDTRNNMLAQGFASQNIANEKDILNKLQTMSNFSTQPTEDQTNTAKKIAELIKQQNVATPTQPWQPTQEQTTQPFTTEEMIDSATENTIQNEQQAFLQDIYRSGTIYDRNKEDLEEQNRLINQNLERKAEDTRIGVERQIDDVIMMTERGVAWYEMVWALKWFNRSSGFVNGLVNIKDDANRTISRLKEDLTRYADATGEAKDEAMTQLQTNMWRAKEDFEYAMRDVMSLAQVDMNAAISKYNLDPWKLWQKLDTITLDVLQRREDLLWTYLNNAKTAISNVNDQLTLIEQYDGFIGQQRDRFTTILDANDWAALANMTPSMIQEYVNQWYLAPEQGAAYFELMKGKSVASLEAYGKPTAEDVTRMMSLIDGGMSPTQAVAKIMDENPERYQEQPERKQWADGVLRREWADWTPEIFQLPKSEWTRQQAKDWTRYKSNQKSMPTWGWPTPNVNYTPTDRTTLEQAAIEYTSQFKDWQKWPRDWRCGQYVNDYLKSAGVSNTNLFLDPITQKANLSNSQTATVGSIAIMDSPTAPEFWHVGIVTQVNADGSFVMKESNYTQPWMVSTRTIPAWGATYGFFDPTVEKSTANSDEKSARLALTKRWWLTKTDQKEIAALAIKEWWVDEYNEALKQWSVVDMSDTQLQQYNKEYDRFLGNAEVKWFESWLSQFQWLWYALWDQSWPWDMAWVFTFMKTLDPDSVVRETEFEAAAKSAGVAARRSNIYDKVSEGKVLTESQAGDFKRIAKVFIEQKAQTYDRLYKNMTNSFEKFWIPEELAPLKASDQLREYLKATWQTPATKSSSNMPDDNSTDDILSILGRTK